MSATLGTGLAVVGEHAPCRAGACRSVLAPVLLGVLGAATLTACGSSQPPVIPGVVRVVAGRISGATSRRRSVAATSGSPRS